MPRIRISCEVCGSGWDGGIFTEYPNLKICNFCTHLAAIRLMDLLGEEFIRDTLSSPDPHFISMLTHEQFYPTRTGAMSAQRVDSYVGNFHRSAPSPAIPPADYPVGYDADSRDTGLYSPEGGGSQSSGLFEESPIEAKTGDAE